MAQKFVFPTPVKGPFVLGPDSKRQPGVPEGTVTKYEWRSSIFPGTFRPYWLYVPAQYTADKPANVMIFQDGDAYARIADDYTVHAPIAFDNLIHQGKIPVTIGIFIDPGYFPPAGQCPWISNRSFEYDSLTDLYARFLIEEILPSVGKQYNLTTEAAGRTICGVSSGGICSFTVAWHRPDMFRNVLSHVGSFADFRGGHNYPVMIRKTPLKPIRVFLQAGTEDLDIPQGHWPLANLEMAAALNFAGYDYRLEYGDGGHDIKHGGAIFGESLLWLWR